MNLNAGLYLAPALLLLLLFQIGPLFYNFFISVHDWGIRSGDYVGLANYTELLHDKQLWNSLGVTLWYVLLVVPTEIVLGMIIAVLLFHKLRATSLFRLIYFLPYVTSMVAIGIVWGWIFNANLGFINSFLRIVGLPEPQWLLEPAGIFFGFGPSLALVTIVFVTIWYYVGFHAVIFLAGLTNIPPEFEEAAIIDGASGWQVFRHITVPLLSPTTYMLAIISTIGSFQSFTLIYVMAGMGWGGFGASRGDPLGTTQVITLLIFDSFYRLFDTGYGAAIATTLFIIILILTIINMLVTRRRVFYLGG